MFNLYSTESYLLEAMQPGLITYYEYEIMYLLSSGLRSNYEGGSRIYVCAFVKPLVLPGCLPLFPTDLNDLSTNDSTPLLATVSDRVMEGPTGQIRRTRSLLI